jgi:hypothetical protein
MLKLVHNDVFEEWSSVSGMDGRELYEMLKEALATNAAEGGLRSLG